MSQSRKRKNTVIWVVCWHTKKATMFKQWHCHKKVLPENNVTESSKKKWQLDFTKLPVVYTHIYTHTYVYMGICI